MRLLVVTQEIDTESKTLSFFHAWVEALAPHYDSVEVICLKAGTHTLPLNVRVHSLGKERGAVPPFVYAWRFISLAWKLRGAYDAVFVHMNQEYILIAGLLWKWLRKPVYLWRNHYAGSVLTDIAAYFCAKVFCTSTHSYTARFKKTVLMPVGVELEAFSKVRNQERPRNSLLFLARIAPSKRLEMLIDALEMVHENGTAVMTTIVGDALPEHTRYLEALKERIAKSSIRETVQFVPGVTHQQTPMYFGSHALFVNCSQSGMFDKTLFEAAAAGCIVLAVSQDFAQLAGREYGFNSAYELSVSIQQQLVASSEVFRARQVHLEGVAQEQSLATLVDLLAVKLAAPHV